MSTIGTTIVSVRRKIPDPLPTLPAPAATFSVVLSTLGTLTAGTYFAKATQLNAYGETLASTESAGLVVTGTSVIQCVSALLPGAITLRVYLTLPGGAAGSEIAFQDFPVPITAPVQVTSFPLTANTPPVIATAVLPDADGQTFSANMVFGWMNNGLNKLSHAVGGILDYCGVPTMSGNGLYVIPGQWLTITDVWYGGYWIKGGKRAEYFRRNTVTSNVLQLATISVQSDRQVIEVTYQPDRNSGLTYLTSQIGPADTIAFINSPSVFLLPFGFAQIGGEIVAYSQLGFSTVPSGYGQGGYGGGGYGGTPGGGQAMSGLIRGIGNTVPQPWPNGEAVVELSLFWNGRRIFNTPYTPGQSNTPLPIPYGWVPILEDYMLAQAKKAEQDLQGWKTLEKSAFDAAKEWMFSNREIPTGVQVGGNNNPVVYDQTVAGGLLIP